MGKLLKIIVVLVGLLGLAGSLLLFYWLPQRVDKRMNLVLDHPPYGISEKAVALHKQLQVADLHGDTLLWMRDPLKRQTRGHIDVPRLREGGVTLQVFSVVTKVPKGLNYDANTADSDEITLLAIAQRWPVAAWGSIYARAEYQARRLHKIARRSDGQLRIIRTQSDLAEFLAARDNNPNLIAGLLATEGAHPLEGKIENVKRLYDEGYRMIGLQHFFDNELGGSLHGVSNGGLTDFGRDVVGELDRLAIVIDVAHSSEAVVRDVLALTDRPIIVSHTGLKGMCDVKRNIDEALMREIAERGGLIGIGYWQEVTCDDSPEGIAKIIAYGIAEFGVDAIALGSDFDGAITTRLDTSELAALTDALLRQGVSEDDIKKVMGGNVLRFFAQNLPVEGAQ